VRSYLFIVRQSKFQRLESVDSPRYIGTPQDFILDFADQQI